MEMSSVEFWEEDLEKFLERDLREYSWKSIKRDENGIVLDVFNPNVSMADCIALKEEIGRILNAPEHVFMDETGNIQIFDIKKIYNALWDEIMITSLERKRLAEEHPYLEVGDLRSIVGSYL